MPFVIQKPNKKIAPAYSRLMFVFGENPTTISSAYYYRYVVRCEVRELFYAESTDTFLSINEHQIDFKIAPNREKKGVVDISKVIKDYVTTDIQSGNDGYAIHNVRGIKFNVNSLIRVKVFLSSELTTSSLGTIVGGAASINEGNLIETYLIFNGCQQDKDGLEFDLSKYTLNGSGNFLTCFDHTIERKVRLTDYGNVSFLNGTLNHPDGSTDLITVYGITIKFYEDDDTLISSNALNSDAGLVSNSQTDGILFAGVAPKNLTDNGITIPTNTAYYTIYAGNQMIGGNPPVSRTYTYRIVGEDCKGHETIRLAFLNRVGGYDYYNFNKRSTRATNIGKEMFKKNTGSWQNDDFSYNTFEHQNTTLNVQAIETIEANTEYITEAEAEGLEELFTSPRVLMLDDTGEWHPVNVAENSYTKQRNVSDKLIQYIISVEKSIAKRIQTN